MKPPGSVCRKSASDCDLPEHCSGESQDCPEDGFEMNGKPCYSQGQGFCYNGRCPTHEQHCWRLFGTGTYNTLRVSAAIHRRKQWCPFSFQPPRVLFISAFPVSCHMVCFFFLRNTAWNTHILEDDNRFHLQVECFLLCSRGQEWTGSLFWPEQTGRGRCQLWEEQIRLHSLRFSVGISVYT